MNVIGNYLLDLRITAGKDQASFAERISTAAMELGLKPVSDKTYSRWETGKQLPSLGYLKALSMVTDVSLEKLLDAYDFGSFRRYSITRDDQEYAIGLNLLFERAVTLNDLIVFLKCFLLAHSILSPEEPPAAIIAAEPNGILDFTDGRLIETIREEEGSLILQVDTVGGIAFKPNELKDLQPISTHHNYCYELHCTYDNTPLILLFSFFIERDPEGYAEVSF